MKCSDIQKGKKCNPEITEKLKSLREQLKKAEQKLKDKQKECRNTEKYKSIGKEQEDEEKTLRKS